MLLRLAIVLIAVLYAIIKLASAVGDPGIAGLFTPVFSAIVVVVALEIVTFRARQKINLSSLLLLLDAVVLGCFWLLVCTSPVSESSIDQSLLTHLAAMLALFFVVSGVVAVVGIVMAVRRYRIDCEAFGKHAAMARTASPAVSLVAYVYILGFVVLGMWRSFGIYP